MSDDFVQDPNEHMQLQQTVYAQIIEKSEKDQKKITMTSKASAIQADQSDLTFGLFQDLEKIKKASNAVSFDLGDVVNCVVQDVTEFGLDTLIEDHEGLRGLCPMSGIQGLEIPSKGQTVAG
jgi:predicted RNA-binding protein with RPS1 domain